METPISFPIIWAITYSTGNFLLGNSTEAADGIKIGQAMKDILSACWNGDMTAAGAGFSEIWTPFLYPMLIGGSLLGLLVAIPIYFLTRRGTMLFRERRRNQMLKKAASIRNKAREMVDQQRLTGNASQT